MVGSALCSTVLMMLLGCPDHDNTYKEKNCSKTVRKVNCEFMSSFTALINSSNDGNEVMSSSENIDVEFPSN